MSIKERQVGFIAEYDSEEKRGKPCGYITGEILPENSDNGKERQGSDNGRRHTKVETHKQRH